MKLYISYFFLKNHKKPIHQVFLFSKTLLVLSFSSSCFQTPISSSCCSVVSVFFFFFVFFFFCPSPWTISIFLLQRPQRQQRPNFELRHHFAADLLGVWTTRRDWFCILHHHGINTNYDELHDGHPRPCRLRDSFEEVHWCSKGFGDSCRRRIFLSLRCSLLSQIWVRKYVLYAWILNISLGFFRREF